MITAVCVQVGDTVAAGDAFNGALAVALSEGQTLPNAIPWGQAGAAVSVTRPGAQRTVFEILRSVATSGLSAAERREWLRMALTSQLVVGLLLTRLLHYDLLVLERR